MNAKLLQLLQSRPFWAALIGLIFLVVKALDPGFPLNQEQAANVVYLLAVYILAEAVEGGAWGRIHLGERLGGVLKSRKFWAALVGLGFVVVQGIDPAFPLDQAETTNLVYLVMAYILGTGIKDAAQAPAAGQPGG